MIRPWKQKKKKKLNLELNGGIIESVMKLWVVMFIPIIYFGM